MRAVYCPYCGGRTKSNGRTSSGSQRWRRTACGASTTLRYDDTAGRAPRVAPLQGLPGGDAGRRAVLQAQDGRVLGGLAHDRGRGELAAEGRPAQPPGADVGQASEDGILVVPRSFGGREDGAREARHDADRRGHRLPVQRLLRLAVARGRRAGVGRHGRVGGPLPQGPVPVLAGLMDGNGCSIGTHILSYKPSFLLDINPGLSL